MYFKPVLKEIIYLYIFRFPNVTHMSVRATGLQYLGQLHALAELRGITGLIIMPEGNPICIKSWREYAIYRLAHWGLKEINNEPVNDTCCFSLEMCYLLQNLNLLCFSFTYKVTDEELKAANQTFSGLSDIVLRALPDAPLQPLLARLGKSGNCLVSAKTWLRGTDPALRDVIAKEALQYKKSHVSQVKTLGFFLL